MWNADRLQMTVTFEGEVQGVGFRATTRTFSKELALLGYAQNLPNGSVKVVIQGKKSQCDALIQKLKDRFNLTNIVVDIKSTDEIFTDFQIF